MAGAWIVQHPHHRAGRRSRRSRCCTRASARRTRTTSLPEGFEHARGAFERSQFIPLAVLLGIGVLFYWSGRKTRAEQVELSLVPVAPPTVA